MAGRSFILSKIKGKLENQLQALHDSGYDVKYDSITIDWEKNIVAVYRLSIKRDLDSAFCKSPNFISAKRITAQGFKLMPLLFKKHLSFNTIELDSPNIVLHQNFFEKSTSAKKERREFTIKIDRLKLPDINFAYYDSVTCKPRTTISTNAVIEDFILAFYKDRPPFYNITSLQADSTNIGLPDNLYTIRVKQTKLNLSLGIFDLDTLKIIPHLTKLAFGRKSGYETDRIEGVIPYINLYGLSLYKEDSIALQAKKMTTQIFLKVFRDKRLPFKSIVKPLPIALISNLPFGLNIDSLILNKSYIEYEEFAVDADSAGRVFFTNTYATLNNINNNNLPRHDAIQMIAQASLMGQGDLSVKAVLPWDGKDTKVTGSLRNMDMKKLNLMLEPQAKIRAESGHLDNLAFNFSYDNEKSDGELELNYKDLKLVTFMSAEKAGRKNDRIRKRKGQSEEETGGDKKQISSVKTLVLNAIVRKNMDGSLPEEKNHGTIHFERDKTKSIFNYWFKSLLSGVKSAYKIDKIQDSGIVKLLKKKEKNKDKG